MLAREEIYEWVREASTIARRTGLTPALFEHEHQLLRDDPRSILKCIPFIGRHLPKGWERVRITPEFDSNRRGIYADDNGGFGAYFVDATGFGRESEPALTAGEFLRRIRLGYGYAIVEAGQYQVKIGVAARRFRKEQEYEQAER